MASDVMTVARSDEMLSCRVCDIASPHRRCLHDSGGYPATGGSSAKESSLEGSRDVAALTELNDAVTIATANAATAKRLEFSFAVGGPRRCRLAPRASLLHLLPRERGATPKIFIRVLSHGNNYYPFPTATTIINYIIRWDKWDMANRKPERSRHPALPPVERATISALSATRCCCEGVGARNRVVAGQAALRYSLMSPPQRVARMIRSCCCPLAFGGLVDAGGR